MLRLAIRFTTLASLVAALAISIWWWLSPEQDWLQAPCTALALVAGLSGIPADRWAAAAARRGRALSSLRNELSQNRQVLTDPRFRPEHQGIGAVYPRLMLAALDTTLVSGALDAGRDQSLVRQLLDWRNAADDLNRRLDITEIRLCIVDAIDGEELTLLRNIARRPDGHFAQAARQLDALEATLDAAADTFWQPRWFGQMRRAARNRSE